jgi:hypothetical protein
MLRLSTTLWTALLGSLMLSSSASAAAADDSDNAQCGIYLAVSSTSTVDDATWGLYAGKEISKDTTVGYPDVAMNTFHLKANVGFGANNRMKASEIDFLNRAVDFLEGFIWVPDAAGARFELAEGRTVTAIPGGGVLGGFNPKLTNAVWNHSSAYFRPALGEEPASSHPGRGSISPFFNVGLKSTEEIVAGSEIFLDYGENWAEEDKKEELSKEDHQKVDETILKMVQFFEKHENELDAHSKSQIYSFLGTDVMNAALGVRLVRYLPSCLPPRTDSRRSWRTEVPWHTASPLSTARLNGSKNSVAAWTISVPAHPLLKMRVAGLLRHARLPRAASWLPFHSFRFPTRPF